MTTSPHGGTEDAIAKRLIKEKDVTRSDEGKGCLTRHYLTRARSEAPLIWETVTGTVQFDGTAQPWCAPRTGRRP